jgi:hypothetical protein
MATVTFQEFNFIKQNMEFSKQADKGYSPEKDPVAWNLVTAGNNCGDFVEEIIAQKFRDMGYQAEKTSGGYHYDIKITDNNGNTLAVEVKSGQWLHNGRTFNFQHIKPSNADIFVFCAITATGLEIRFTTKAEMIRYINQNGLYRQYNGWNLRWPCPDNSRESLRIKWPTEDLDSFPPAWAMNLSRFMN